jgi:hypothetical protein
MSLEIGHTIHMMTAEQNSIFLKSSLNSVGTEFRNKSESKLNCCCFQQRQQLLLSSSFVNCTVGFPHHDHANTISTDDDDDDDNVHDEDPMYTK